MERNRSQGWQFAKLDGHANERRICELLKTNPDFLEQVFSQVRGSSDIIQGVQSEILEIGKQNELTIFGDRSSPKPDILVVFANGVELKISVKKSAAGQVWLVTLERFLGVMEHYRPGVVTSDVRKALGLFIGGPRNIVPVRSLFQFVIDSEIANPPKYRRQELRQQRLSASSITRHYPELAKALIEFLKGNVQLLTELMFARGATADQDFWADSVLYTLPDKSIHAFALDDICDLALSRCDEVAFGTKNGGTTVNLPTGFLQMHQGEMQFHHQLDKLVVGG